MGRVGLRSALAGTLVLAALLGPPAATARSAGSGLFTDPNAGICATPAGAPEALCTVTQLRLAHRSIANGGVESDRSGVLARWWVRSGEASPATASVRLRLRVFEGTAPVPGAATPFFPLPLGEPGLHEFPARLPIQFGQRLALDIAVAGSGHGIGAAPIAHLAPGIGEVAEWVPPLSLDPRPPTERLGDTELLLKGAVQTDSDDDGWGDGTQDRCSYDPRRHSPCLPDEVKPRIQIFFAGQQDFVTRHKLFLKVRTHDFARVSTGGVLDTGDTGWGLLGSEAWMKPGDSAIFPVYVNGKPLAAAKRAAAAGGHPYVRTSVYVIDASGNRRFQERRVSLPER
jgi:hypothetical protein